MVFRDVYVLWVAFFCTYFRVGTVENRKQAEYNNDARLRIFLIRCQRRCVRNDISFALPQSTRKASRNYGDYACELHLLHAYFLDYRQYTLCKEKRPFIFLCKNHKLGFCKRFPRNADQYDACDVRERERAIEKYYFADFERSGFGVYYRQRNFYDTQSKCGYKDIQK